MNKKFIKNLWRSGKNSGLHYIPQTILYENRKIILNDLPITDKMNLEKEFDINSKEINLNQDTDRVCFDIESGEEIKQVVKPVLEVSNGFFITTLKDAPWDWKYNWRHAPLISSICEHLFDVNINIIKFSSSKPLEPTLTNHIYYPNNHEALFPKEYLIIIYGKLLLSLRI